MSEIFIRRPVATVLLMLCLLLFGLMSAFQMPINNLPNVEYPTIRISASLPGANSETMAASVALPLEKQFSQIDGVDSMLSSSTQGSTTITIVFDLSRDIDAAAQDVNAAISAAAKQLPPGMTSPPSLKKINPSEQPIMYLSFSSESIPLPDIYKYIDTYVAGTVASMPGVSEVNVYGGKKPAVRVKINPFKTAGLGIGTADITTATAGSCGGNIGSADAKSCSLKRVYFYPYRRFFATINVDFGYSRHRSDRAGHIGIDIFIDVR